MENEVINYLLGLAWDKHIGITLRKDMGPATPSIADADTRNIIINMNWQRKKELPFQIAHEISHILNKDSGVLYFTTYANKSKIERNANLTAVDLLIDYSDSIGANQVNVVQFMEQFGIPPEMEYSVMNKLENRFGI